MGPVFVAIVLLAFLMGYFHLCHFAVIRIPMRALFGWC